MTLPSDLSFPPPFYAVLGDVLMVVVMTTTYLVKGQHIIKYLYDSIAIPLNLHLFDEQTENVN